jgi:hypothetical protein
MAELVASESVGTKSVWIAGAILCMSEISVTLGSVSDHSIGRDPLE